MDESLLDRIGQLEAAVRRAGEHAARLREDNQRLREEHDRLRRELKRLEDERRQVVSQIDAILKDLGKLDLGGGGASA
ncbi:MAG TPA: hypothetical protein VFX28_07520 [Methylomirabilota bacterium]|nr:hypothetical protein [Methylomirabilota bacterium]